MSTSTHRSRRVRRRILWLLMTGHTHGGLLNVPWIGPVGSVCKLGRKYSAGMFSLGGTSLYVSRGIGPGPGSHFRFRSSPEIPVFTLRASHP